MSVLRHKNAGNRGRFSLKTRSATWRRLASSGAAWSFRVDSRRLWRMLSVSGYRELSVTGEHAVAVSELPPIHKDPFDLMLIAQARDEGLLLLTADKLVAQYGEAVQEV